jgi:hypothetical protein
MRRNIAPAGNFLGKPERILTTIASLSRLHQLALKLLIKPT